VRKLVRKARDFDGSALKKALDVGGPERLGVGVRTDPHAFTQAKEKKAGAQAHERTQLMRRIVCAVMISNPLSVQHGRIV
jgi:hypothetical protein